MAKTIVYHDTETLAKRNYIPRPEETVAFRSKEDFDESINENFDKVIDLSSPVIAPTKKGKGNDV